MTSEDFRILDIGFELAASKRKSYRDGVLSRCRVLVQFLQDHELTTRRLLESNEVPDEHFRVMKSDLTSDGYDLIKYGHDRWITCAENPAEDVSILEAELAKILSRKS